jgi:hypothetical protein
VTQGSGLSFQFIKYFIHRLSFASPGLGETTANSGDRIEVFGYLLISVWIKYHGFCFSVDGKHKRSPRFFHPPHQVGRIAFKRSKRVDVLGHINHAPILHLIRIVFNA